MLLRRSMLLLLAFLFTACSGAGQQALPTLMPTLAPVGTNTPVPTELPASTALSRPTLPPTWTPSPQPTAGDPEVQPTPTPEAQIEQPQIQPVTAMPTLVVCGLFAVDRDRSAVLFPLGSTPQVFWRAVETASRYRIRLIDSTGAELFVDYTLEPNYTFRADLFQRDTRYGWVVYPEDSLNQQMCLERGQELIPQ